MKITKCDRCGKEFVGRNPENFAEHVIDRRICIDLCFDCDKEYVKLVNKLELQARKACEDFLGNYIKEMHTCDTCGVNGTVRCYNCSNHEHWEAERNEN
jgi:hypothetical protein